MGGLWGWKLQQLRLARWGGWEAENWFGVRWSLSRCLGPSPLPCVDKVPVELWGAAGLRTGPGHSAGKPGGLPPGQPVGHVSQGHRLRALMVTTPGALQSCPRANTRLTHRSRWQPAR